jgi:rod shape determining protein RodA
MTTTGLVRRPPPSWRGTIVPRSRPARSGAGRLGRARPDLALAAAAIVLSGIGLLMVYSATRGPQAPYVTSYLRRQGLFVGLGIGLMVLTASVDHRRLRAAARPLYVAALASLVAVLSTAGVVSRGAQSWFDVGPFQVQPAEPAKLALIVALAALGARFRDRVDGRRLTVLALCAAVPLGLILLQPDLGTALVLLAITAVVVVVAGTPLRLLAVLAVLALTVTVGVLQADVLAPYQRCRLTSFVDRNDATCVARGAGLSVEESQRAIGAGGVGGQGLFQGNQTRLAFVPEQHTDFIFTAVGEQLGLAGSATVLGMYGLLVWRVLRVAQRCPDRFGALLCAGVLGMLVFQVFESTGMSMGIMPVTGIPLPFLSYGGSATLVAFVAVGMVLSVGRRRA